MLALSFLHKDNQGTIKEIALNLLDKVGLKDKAEAYPNQLSGGQNRESRLREF